MAIQSKTLRRITKLFPGSSFPSEIETTDDSIGVMKMRGTGNGVQSLIAEFLVNRISSEMGWEVPDVFPVVIPTGFPWEIGTDEFDDILQRSFGTNLGIVHLPEAHPLSGSEIQNLPEAFLLRLVALDAFFCNYDRQVKSLNILRDTKKRLWLIDHGSCLFLMPSISRAPIALPPNHFLKNRETEYPVKNLLQEIACRDAVASAISQIPEQWLNESDLGRTEISNIIRQRIAAI